MVRSFRDSGEAKESKQQGTKESRAAQRERGRQAGRELREALDRGKRNVKGTEYTGALADAMRTANINQFNERQLRQRALQDAPPRRGFGETIRGLGRGIMDTLTPGRMIASGIASALFGPIGGILAGALANQRTVDAAKKDFRDTIDFFRPRQKEQPMMTNMPMRRPDQMFPIRSVTETTGMPFMDQIPDMFPDNQGQPTYTPEAAGFGLDSLMQPQQITINPGMGVNVVTDREGNPITYGTNPDDIMQGGFIGFSGTGPISVDFDTMGQPLTQRQMEILRRN
tara:strand:- start:53 stop:904 length:852 start_codon:yes stop_codon:yes gene_type:complete